MQCLSASSCDSIGPDFSLSDFVSWVNTVGTEPTCDPSLRWQMGALERHFSFLSALSALFLMTLILSLSLTWKSISLIYVVQTWMHRLKWVENLLRNRFRKIYTLLSYIGVFKLRPRTIKLEQYGVQIQSPSWRGCVWSKSSYFSRVSLEDTEQAASLLPISGWRLTVMVCGSGAPSEFSHSAQCTPCL